MLKTNYGVLHFFYFKYVFQAQLTSLLSSPPDDNTLLAVRNSLTVPLSYLWNLFSSGKAADPTTLPS